MPLFTPPYLAELPNGVRIKYDKTIDLRKIKMRLPLPPWGVSTIHYQGEPVVDEEVIDEVLKISHRRTFGDPVAVPRRFRFWVELFNEPVWDIFKA